MIELKETVKNCVASYPSDDLTGDSPLYYDTYINKKYTWRLYGELMRSIGHRFTDVTSHEVARVMQRVTRAGAK